MPKFLVKELSYIDDRLVNPGDIVDFEPKQDAEGKYLVSDNLEQLPDDADEDDPKIARKARKLKEEPQAPKDVVVNDPVDITEPKR